MVSTVLNPFIVGGAIGDPSGRGFFGREDIFGFVRSSLLVARRAPILLYGQRRIGKSSILKQLPRHLPSEFICVYFDLQGKASMSLDQVLYGLGRAIADALSIPRPEREEATEDRFPFFLRRAVDALGRQPERLVLLFDEFDVVDPTFAGPRIAASTFIPYLGRLVADHPGIGYVLVVGRKTEELSEGFFSALGKDTVQRRIGRLTLWQTGTLVRDSANGQLNFADAAVSAVFSLAAGHPFCTQALCNVVWSRNFPDAGTRPVPIGAKQIEDALPAAIDFAANGLNWIYDGLTKPAHRVFLSSLATLVDLGSRRLVSLEEVNQALREKRVALDLTDLATAPRELESWDVTTRDGPLIGFAVPMIGSWVRENRPLAGIEEQTRLYNPRAYKYYELGLENVHHENYTAAIEDFRNALVANPAFPEALKGLSAALWSRKGPGDLELAIEAYERVLDLDPGAPRSPLADILADSIDAGGDIKTIEARFKRLKEVDSEGVAVQRANRALNESARRHLADRRSASLMIARTLFQSVGDEANASEADRLNSRRANLVTLFQVAGSAVAAGVGYTLYRWETWPVGVVATEIIIVAIVAAAVWAPGIPRLIEKVTRMEPPLQDRITEKPERPDFHGRDWFDRWTEHERLQTLLKSLRDKIHP